jgi:hypothetical protein
MPQVTPDDAIKLVQQYERTVGKRATWDSVWGNLAALIRPLRIDVRTRRASGQQQTQAIFDGTAPKAASDLASAMYGSMSPVDMQFFRLVMRYKPLNDDYGVRLWLEECEHRMLLAFQQSNFESEAHELYQDLVVFGTGCFLMEERQSYSPVFSGFQFRTVPPGRFTILEGPDSRVQTVMRIYTMTLASAFQVWGRELSDATLAKLEKEPEANVQILHVMRPSPQARQGTRRAYESVYIEYEKKKLLGQQYHRRLRFLVPRWSKTSEEEYGRGQGHLVYPDVATLNRAVEMRFKQWAKQLDPPVLTLDDGVLGKLRLTAGSRTVVSKLDAVKPFETGARWDVNQFNEADLKAAIRNGFYADKLQLPNKQYMTAYEIQQQVEIMQRELGPTIGRVKFEFLNGLVENGFDLMMHAGAIPPPPDVVLMAAQQGLGSLGIEYESPLVRSQRTGDLVALERTINAVAPLASINPEIMDNFDLDWITRHSGETAGLPQQALREIGAVQELRAQKQQQVAEQQAGATMEQGSMIAKNIGTTAKDMATAAQSMEGAGNAAS